MDKTTEQAATTGKFRKVAGTIAFCLGYAIAFIPVVVYCVILFPYYVYKAK